MFYEQALDVATRLGFRPEVALTRLGLAKVLLQMGEAEKRRAVDHLDFAIKEFEAMKMRPSFERARALKASLDA